jgi:hypothetical protein
VFVGGTFLGFPVQLHDAVGQELALMRLDADVPASRRAGQSDRNGQDPEAVKK